MPSSLDFGTSLKVSSKVAGILAELGGQGSLGSRDVDEAKSEKRHGRRVPQIRLWEAKTRAAGRR